MKETNHAIIDVISYYAIIILLLQSPSGSLFFFSFFFFLLLLSHILHYAIPAEIIISQNILWRLSSKMALKETYHCTIFFLLLFSGKRTEEKQKKRLAFKECVQRHISSTPTFLRQKSFPKNSEWTLVKTYDLPEQKMGLES